MTLDIRLIPARADNYAVLIHDGETGAVAAIDAPAAAPLIAVLEEEGWTLTDILVTHHHADHTDGIEELKSIYTPRVIAPASEAHKIPAVDQTVADGDSVNVGSIRFDVIETPGHTLGHVVYHSAAEKLLFAGDTLFVMGCGRLFEGTPEMMWGAMKRLRNLPDDTKVYCGHEYTLTNARFAAGLEPRNAAVTMRLAQVEAMRLNARPTVPTTMGREKTTNPFLRADDPALAAALTLPANDPVAVFAALRNRRNKA